jgi:DNA polymerase I
MKNIIAIDIETTGLYPIRGRSKIFCCAVNDGKKITIYEDVEKLRKVLEDDKIQKVIHNAGFDSFWFKRLHGIDVRNIWDTRLMEQVLLGENLPKSEKSEEAKLELSTSLYYTLKRYKLATIKQTLTGDHFARKPINSPLTTQEKEYVKEDVQYLLKLQALQQIRLTRLDLTRVANLENSLVEEVVKMRDRGIGLDVDAWERIAAANERALNNLLKKLPSDVSNWNSPAQVKQYFTRRGIPVETLTGIEELKDIYNDKVLNTFIEMRKLVKSVTTYGISWLEDSIKGSTYDEDYRVRADFEQILNTGRFSCSHPNLQQLPREGQHRAAFVPKKGNVFVIADFSGQELGIMASAAKEELWIKAILRGEDVHSLTASMLYPEWNQVKEKGCTFPKKCKCSTHAALRHNAKTINFAIAYGAGPGKIGKSLKLSDREATNLLNKYKRVVPNLTRWLRTNADFSIKTRTSFSADPFRRRRTLRDPEDWMLANIGKNNPVQSAGANMIKLSMVSAPDLPFVLTIHDELIIECKASEAKKFSTKLKGIMEKAADYCTGIPGLIKVEPIISKSLQKNE